MWVCSGPPALCRDRMGTESQRPARDRTSGDAQTEAEVFVKGS